MDLAAVLPPTDSQSGVVSVTACGDELALAIYLLDLPVVIWMLADATHVAAGVQVCCVTQVSSCLTHR